MIQNLSTHRHSIPPDEDDGDESDPIPKQDVESLPDIGNALPAYKKSQSLV